MFNIPEKLNMFQQLTTPPPSQFKPLGLIRPATFEDDSNGNQEGAVDQLNQEHEQVIVDELCRFIVFGFHLFGLTGGVTKEAAKFPHVWIVFCGLGGVAGVNDGSDDVDQKRNSLSVQSIEQELLQILPERLLWTSNVEQSPDVEAHGVDPEHGPDHLDMPLLLFR